LHVCSKLDVASWPPDTLLRYTRQMFQIQDFSHRWLRRPYALHAAIDTSDGSKTTILLHGLASNGLVWGRLASYLARENYRVIAYDLLGFGNSAKPNWLQYNVEDHARSVVYSIKKSGAKFPVILVGHSMGCLVAVHIASKYPQLVKRVVLYEPPLFADIPEFSSHIRRRKIYFSIFERIVDSPTMILTYARLLGRAATKVAGFALDEATWVPFERSLRNTIMGQAAYRELHALQVSTDIVYGRFDIVVTQTEVKQMFADNKNISFYNIADTHGISNKSAQYLARLISNKNRKRQKRRRVAYVGRKRDNTSIRKAG
jgi:pimeloyl-ACP methyl ester carboxylesterase